MAAKSQGGWGRNWDEMMRNYSSGEDSDEHDIPNLMSFQKNVRRNAQLIQSFIPHMTPEGAQTIPPMLMQDPYVMHEDLLKSGFFDSVRSSGSPAMVGDGGGGVGAVAKEPAKNLSSCDPPSSKNPIGGVAKGVDQVKMDSVKVDSSPMHQGLEEQVSAESSGPQAAASASEEEEEEIQPVMLKKKKKKKDEEEYEDVGLLV